ADDMHWYVIYDGDLSDDGITDARGRFAFVGDVVYSGASGRTWRGKWQDIAGLAPGDVLRGGVPRAAHHDVAYRIENGRAKPLAPIPPSMQLEYADRAGRLWGIDGGSVAMLDGHAHPIPERPIDGD